jgi:uncharacterized protein YjlB
MRTIFNQMIRFMIIFFMILHFSNGQSNGPEYMGKINQEAEILYYHLKDDGIFPNNEKLPLIVYRQAIRFEEEGPGVVEDIFYQNGWRGSWRNGIYGFHHYHSTAHEVLGVYQGNCRVQLGGPAGEIFEIKKGDVVLIPAGVAHKNLGSSQDFKVVGAYPDGQSWDMNDGKEGERPTADRNIAKVKLPSKDPVFGDHGPAKDRWKP